MGMQICWAGLGCQKQNGNEQQFLVPICVCVSGWLDKEWEGLVGIMNGIH